MEVKVICREFRAAMLFHGVPVWDVRKPVMMTDYRRAFG
jgi:hypothetical protein